MRDADSLILLADYCEGVASDEALGLEDLFGVFRAAWPLPAFPSKHVSDIFRDLFLDLWAGGAAVRAAAVLAPEGCIYRSGRDVDGPATHRFLCEVVPDRAPYRTIRAVADTEALARVAAFLRAHIPLEDKPT